MLSYGILANTHARASERKIAGSSFLFLTTDGRNRQPSILQFSPFVLLPMVTPC